MNEVLNTAAQRCTASDSRGGWKPHPLASETRSRWRSHAEPLDLSEPVLHCLCGIQGNINGMERNSRYCECLWVGNHDFKSRGQLRFPGLPQASDVNIIQRWTRDLAASSAVKHCSRVWMGEPSRQSEGRETETMEKKVAANCRDTTTTRTTKQKKYHRKYTFTL
jgi:hypothetical protein